MTFVILARSALHNMAQVVGWQSLAKSLPGLPANLSFTFTIYLVKLARDLTRPHPNGGLARGIRLFQGNRVVGEILFHLARYIIHHISFIIYVNICKHIILFICMYPDYDGNIRHFADSELFIPVNKW